MDSLLNEFRLVLVGFLRLDMTSGVGISPSSGPTYPVKLVILFTDVKVRGFQVRNVTPCWVLVDELEVMECFLFN